MRMLVMIGALGLAGAANAQLTFIGTNGENYYRGTGGVVDSFVLDTKIVGMDMRPSGAVWASSPDTDGPAGIYEIDNAFNGAPMANLLSASDVYTSLTFVSENELYGFFDGSQNFYSINTGDFSGTNIGPVGVNNHTWGGTAYDPASDTMYALGRDLGTDEVFLFTIDDYATSPSASLVGSTGILGDGMGLDWFDGALYAGIQNLSNMHFEAGSVNVGSGEFTLLETLAESFSPDGDTTSLIVIPAPAGVAVLGLAGFAAIRRRR